MLLIVSLEAFTALTGPAPSLTFKASCAVTFSTPSSDPVITSQSSRPLHDVFEGSSPHRDCGCRFPFFRLLLKGRLPVSFSVSGNEFPPFFVANIPVGSLPPHAELSRLNLSSGLLSVVSSPRLRLVSPEG